MAIYISLLRKEAYVSNFHIDEPFCAIAVRADVIEE